jgi:hypothetical protein
MRLLSVRFTLRQFMITMVVVAWMLGCMQLARKSLLNSGHYFYLIPELIQFVLVTILLILLLNAVRLASVDPARKRMLGNKEELSRPDPTKTD